jgi:hypothetical protein
MSLEVGFVLPLAVVVDVDVPPLDVAGGAIGRIEIVLHGVRAA